MKIDIFGIRIHFFLDLFCCEIVSFHNSYAHIDYKTGRMNMVSIQRKYWITKTALDVDFASIYHFDPFEDSTAPNISDFIHMCS